MRWVSFADQAAKAPMTVSANEMLPIVSGTLADPGGATTANTLQRAADPAARDRFPRRRAGSRGPVRFCMVSSWQW